MTLIDLHNVQATWLLAFSFGSVLCVQLDVAGMRNKSQCRKQSLTVLVLYVTFVTYLKKFTHYLQSPETSVHISCLDFLPVTVVAAPTQLSSEKITLSCSLMVL